MELFEAIAKRRSVRQFENNKPVDDETVRKILEAGIRAPSAGNGQCWCFIAVRDQELKKRLALEAGHQPFINDAPVVIVVCADLEAAEQSYGERGRKTYSLQDTAAAIENMLLAITSFGLGTCWVGAFNESVASEILKLPGNFRPVAMLPIGVPAKSSIPATPRKKFEEVVSFR